MTPSQQAKAAGLPSLAAVIKITGAPKRTLYDWHKHKPNLFRAVIIGCAEINRSKQND